MTGLSCQSQTRLILSSPNLRLAPSRTFLLGVPFKAPAISNRRAFSSSRATPSMRIILIDFALVLVITLHARTAIIGSLLPMFSSTVPNLASSVFDVGLSLDITHIFS